MAGDKWEVFEASWCCMEENRDKMEFGENFCGESIKCLSGLVCEVEGSWW